MRKPAYDGWGSSISLAVRHGNHVRPVQHTSDTTCFFETMWTGRCGSQHLFETAKISTIGQADRLKVHVNQGARHGQPNSLRSERGAQPSISMCRQQQKTPIEQRQLLNCVQSRGKLMSGLDGSPAHGQLVNMASSLPIGSAGLGLALLVPHTSCPSRQLLLPQWMRSCIFACHTAGHISSSALATTTRQFVGGYWFHHTFSRTCGCDWLEHTTCKLPPRAHLRICPSNQRQRPALS